MKAKLCVFSLMAAFVAVSFAACNKIKSELFPSFDTDISEVTVTVPATAAGVEATASNTVSFNLDSAIKAYTRSTFSINNLSSVKVKDISIFVLNPDSENDASNFESISLKISSSTNSTPALVASAAIPNSYSTSVNIDAANGPELKEYLRGNNLTYAITGKTRRAVTKPLTLTVLVTLSIK